MKYLAMVLLAIIGLVEFTIRLSVAALCLITFLPGFMVLMFLEDMPDSRQAQFLHNYFSSVAWTTMNNLVTEPSPRAVNRQAILKEAYALDIIPQERFEELLDNLETR